MATFADACAEAARISANEQCCVHVVAQILVPSGGEPYLNPQGYQITGWLDGTVVATYAFGHKRD